MKRQFLNTYDRKNKGKWEAQRQSAKQKKSELLNKYKQVESLKRDGENIHITTKKLRSGALDVEIKKSKKKAQKKKRVKKKRELLARWFDEDALMLISDSKVDKYKIEDLEKGNISGILTGNIFEPVIPFNPKTVYSLSEAFKLSFVDWSENITLEDALSLFKGKGFYYNLEKLKEINSLKVTGTGKAGTSGGMPGSVMFTYGSQNWLKQFAVDRGVQTRRWRKFAKERQHTNSRLAGWQHLSSGGSTSITSITPEQVLEIANAVMYHVNENGREDFYSDYYDFFTREIPSLKGIMPNPKFSF